MAAEDVIRSYLISLGFKADDASFNKVKDTLKKLDENVKQKTTSMSAASASYVVAGSAIASALTSVTLSVAGLLDKVAQADLGYQKFALRMYMARDAAKEFKIVTDSMGEKPEDIAWNTELLTRYRALMSEAYGMRLPKDNEAQLKYIRSIRHEFDRLKVEATYGLQWVGYYLFKYLEKPIVDTKEGFKSFNDYIQERMPIWSEKIARAFALVMEIVKSTLRGLGTLYDKFSEWFDKLPEWEKRLILFGGAVAGVFMLGPFGKAILVLTTIIALIDEFYAAMSGKETLLPTEALWGFASALDAVAKALYAVYLGQKLLLTIPVGLVNSILFPAIDTIMSLGKGVEGSRERAQVGMRLEGMWEDIFKGMKGDADKLSALFGKIKTGEGLLFDEKTVGEKFSLSDEQRRAETERLRRFYSFKQVGPTKYDEKIEKAAKEYGVDPALIKAIIEAESSFKDKQVSPKGAIGPMQLMPGTAKDMKVDPHNIEQNIMGGTKYLRFLIDYFKGDVPKAIAAYNAGFGNVMSYGDIPPFKETQDYVKRVQAAHEKYSRGGRLGYFDYLGDYRERGFPGISRFETQYGPRISRVEPDVVNNNLTFNLYRPNSDDEMRTIDKIIREHMHRVNSIDVRMQAGVQ